jgi:gliding motility-associated-like protein
VGLNVEPNSISICQGSTVSVTIAGSQSGVSYQFFNGANPSGAAVNGNGATITLTSGVVSANATLTILATETFLGGTSATLTENVVVTIVTPPTTANAGADQIICGLSTNLNGNNPTSGTGNWIQVSGPASATISNPAQRNSQVTVPVSGTYIFQWIISRAPCNPTSDNVSIIFSQPPTTANAGADQVVCGLTTNLSANAPSAGSATWFLVSGPGGAAFSNSSSASTSVTVFIPGVYILQWSIFSGVCPVSSDQVRIEFYAETIVADAGIDQDLCGLSTQMNGNSVSPQTGAWTQISGPTTATITTPDAPDAIMTVPSPGTYVFRWTVTNPPCITTFDEVSITFNFSAEVCDGFDNDCDLSIDEDFDLDFDGFTTCGGDCDDTRNTVYPGATEICDELDNDCDLTIDEGVQLTFYRDADSDGFGNNAITQLACTAPLGFVSNNTDCNDANATIFPGAVEICNLLDDDCDTQIDEGVQLTFYRDADSDGFGNAAVTTEACTAPAGYVSNSTDCDDTNASVFPGAPETCNLLDDDCDTQIDEGVQLTFYRDADGDTFGNAAVTTQACTAPAGYVSNNTDCDDTNAAIRPSASEVCNNIDDNCNTQIDEGVQLTFFRDADGDTFGNASVTVQACSAPVGFVSNSTDCNDANAAIFPGAAEVCNTIDDDCDTQIDEGVQLTFYQDADGDTFGNVAVTIQACTAPLGYVSNNTDCDDTNAAIRPTATETCNLIDDNCNTQIDEGVQSTFYQDADGDTFGNVAVTIQACTAPIGYVSNNTDCDDTNAAVRPNATETCNNIDDNCNTQIDEGVQTTFYRDADGDGFGNNAVTTQACSVPVGYVVNNTDCNDANGAVFPGATEVCNLIDDNCNTSIDEGVQTTFYRDADGDTFGNPLNTIQACTAPVGYVSNNTDCNDSNAAIRPTAAEICNNIDDNCNTQIDEGVQFTFYRDQDGDSFGNPAATIQACTAPVGYVNNNTDCNDSNSSIFPNATETCNNLDDNCNTQIDEGVLLTWYQDGDGDGFGNAAVNVQSCTAPIGFVSNNTDCDDSNFAIFPTATETCNNLDDNCNTQIDEGVLLTFYQDADGDSFGNAAVSIQACAAPAGYVSNSTDCNDGNAQIFPGALETCNLLDDNCNTTIDEGVQTTFFRDADGDGFGNAALTTQACTQPLGYVSDNTDCDDNNGAVNTSAVEICNTIDDNCNTQIDEGVQTTFFRDADGDGFGNASVTVQACSAPVGFVSDNTDCNDNSAAMFPGNAEICDNLDNNCNTQIDEGTQITFYQDADGDGFGNINVSTNACSAPLGYVSDNTDCNDSDASLNPGEPELCDNLDNNCDTQIDEGVLVPWYADADGDGYGDATIFVITCTPPAGYVADDTDCDDADATVNPGEIEVCDNLDNDCDFNVDEGATTRFYADTDGDTFGDATNFVDDCTAPIGYTTDSSDCDDGDATVNPTATEICDNIDNNCDTQIDEGLAVVYYPDADGDGFGAPIGTPFCAPPVGYVLDNTDCDDNNAAINTAATEVCDNVDNNCDTQIDEGLAVVYYPDADGDGFGAPIGTPFCAPPAGYVLDNTDCDDSNAAINTAATEVCDNLDNDCDTQIDEGLTLTFFADTDGDGFGDPANTTVACTAPAGFVSDNTDCDDTNAAINSAATEVCDNADNNCNTQVDEGTLITFYADADGDGFGDATSTTEACSAPTGYVADNTDCDDTNAAINTAATEVCDNIDNNCDTQIDEGTLITFYADADGDGFGNPSVTAQACVAPVGYVSNNTDCDDTNAAINTGATEVCDNIDNNCDTQIDEGVLISFYTDADGDGFGDENATATLACTAPAGTVSNNADCDDADAAINPAATEICDNIDNNCDTQIDEGLLADYYVDADGDGFGDANATPINTCSPPAGSVTNNADCDDADTAVNPSATEICDNIDNNCDTQIDEGLLADYYVDADGDGFGDANATPINTCNPPAGSVTNNADCDDADAAVNPSATEICDEIDNNCDTQIDEGVTTTFYADADGDGFGDANTTVLACTQPAGAVANNTDCDDTNASINPSGTEICDSVDNNCDTQIDEGVTTTFYTDADGDGFGDANATVSACTQPAGTVTNSADCDDTNAAINPSGTEVCDNLDNNCDTQIDEGVLSTFFADTDADGFGDASATIQACVAPVGYVADNTDCDDTNNTVYPGATETCDNLDNNCNTQIDEGTGTNWYVDADGDGFGDALATAVLACNQPTGFSSNNSDCNDADNTINPASVETCDNVDNNCDTQIDEGLATDWYTDADGDGFGDANAIPTNTCAQPTGTVSNNADCDDNDINVNPTTAEICDGIDNNCDTQIDEGVGTNWYGDADGDGFGDANATPTFACTQPTGTVADNTDCDDTDMNVNTAAVEVCDEIDNNCNVLIDEGLTSTYYVDLDGDGFGDPMGSIITACSLPDGFASNNSDCDDTNSAINPSATEVCDNVDNNCDVQIDEGAGTNWYTDADGDGFGDINSTPTVACIQPIGTSSNNSDCDDNVFEVNPAAAEICDELDNNCDTQIDEGVTTTWYEDSDSDGFGDDNSTTVSCTQPTGYVSVGGDCNDNSAFQYPGQAEQCDGLDNDCNTLIDDGVGTTWYADTDGDGFGDESTTETACTQPTGFVADAGDCDDTNNNINPLATEECDGFDNNCDTQIDEGFNPGECVDTDLDGVVNLFDVDDDNDGITDATEIATAQNNGDTDGDTTPDIWDLDSDADGMNDVFEAGASDPDNDGVIGTGAIVDLDGDGLSDDVAPNGVSPVDTDNDALPDFQDTDSDGDKASDANEFDANNDTNGPDDTDGDGILDYLDTDDDADGLLTAVEYDQDGDGIAPDDCDGDGTPNYLDTDPCSVFIPEGFSPNGDGVNETFVIDFVPNNTSVKLEVFNRWGSVVYSADNYKNEWDGRSNQGSSQDLPSGTYFYKITLSKDNSEYVGYITLWR